jgi:hypothetical protein
MRGIITSRRRQLGRWRRDDRERLGAVGGRDHGEPALREHAGADERDVFTVVDDQDGVSHGESFQEASRTATTRARAGSGASVAAMRRAVLLARMKPVPRASSAEGAAGPRAATDLERRAGRELDAVGGGEAPVNARRPVTRRRPAT